MSYLCHALGSERVEAYQQFFPQVENGLEKRKKRKTELFCNSIQSFPKHSFGREIRLWYIQSRNRPFPFQIDLSQRWVIRWFNCLETSRIRRGRIRNTTGVINRMLKEVLYRIQEGSSFEVINNLVFFALDESVLSPFDWIYPRAPSLFIVAKVEDYGNCWSCRSSLWTTLWKWRAKTRKRKM